MNRHAYPVLIPTVDQVEHVDQVDQVTLAGEVSVGSDDWAIVIHDLGADLDQLRPLDAQLCRAGFSVLSIDLRGHGGSTGDPTAHTCHLDVAAAAQWLRGKGASTISVLAAGNSCLGALAAAESSTFQSVVLIDPRGSTDEATAVLATTGPGTARLVIRSAANDMANVLYRRLRGTTMLISIPFEGTTAALIDSDWQRQIFSHSTGFLCQSRGRSVSDSRPPEPDRDGPKSWQASHLDSPAI